MKHLIIKVSRMFVIAATSLVSLPVLAVNPGVTGGGTGVGTLLPGGGVAVSQTQNSVQLAQIITNVVNIFASVIITIAIVMLLWAGFRFMTSGEDEEALVKARKTLTYGIIGIVVALLAYTIPTILSNFVLGGGTQ